MGVQLDLEGNTLDTIKLDNPGNAKACCREAFKEWSKKCTSASWELLLQALESKGVGEKTLAKDFRKRLLSGILYWYYTGGAFLYIIEDTKEPNYQGEKLTDDKKPS